MYPLISVAPSEILSLSFVLKILFAVTAWSFHVSMWPFPLQLWKIVNVFISSIHLLWAFILIS